MNNRLPSAQAFLQASASYRMPLSAGVAASILALFTLHARPAAAADWPEFKGRLGRGVAVGERLRSTWNESEGIAWKADLPGRGASSPIVVGDLVVVTAASGPRQDRLHVLALDRQSGKPRWHRTFWAAGRTLCHSTSSVAAGTPACDGKRIVALYSSCDLFALDLEGRLLWQRNLAVEHPKSGNDVGMGASPRIIDGTVVVQVDCQGDAFATGIDVATGSERWLVPREKIASWSSPIEVSIGGEGPCVLMQNPNGLELRKPVDGSIVWNWKGECSGIPMTTESGGILLVPGSGLSALRPQDAADGAPEQPAWSSTKLSCGIASPLVWGDSVACVNRAGVLGVGSLSDGSLRGQVRLAGSFWASPIVVGDTIVAANKEGTTFLVSVDADGTPQILGQNQLPGTFTATPAVADGSLYLRSEEALWKVAAP